jgi:hypothetical protein
LSFEGAFCWDTFVKLRSWICMKLFLFNWRWSYNSAAFTSIELSAPSWCLLHGVAFVMGCSACSLNPMGFIVCESATEFSSTGLLVAAEGLWFGFGWYRPPAGGSRSAGSQW